MQALRTQTPEMEADLPAGTSSPQEAEEESEDDALDPLAAAKQEKRSVRGAEHSPRSMRAGFEDADPEKEADVPAGISSPQKAGEEPEDERWTLWQRPSNHTGWLGADRSFTGLRAGFEDPDPEKEADVPAGTSSPQEAEEESDDDALDPLAAAKQQKRLARRGIAFSPTEAKVGALPAKCCQGVS